MIPKFLREATSTIPLSPWIIGPVLVVLWLAILLAGKRRALGATRRYLAGRTNWIWTDALIEAMSPALTVVIWSTGLALLDRILPLCARLDHIVDVILAGAVALTLVIFGDRISYRLLARLSLRSSAVKGALSLIQGIVRGVIIGLGILVFLDSVGISITPIIASLGIGTLAVALALQDTLANVFAGLYMIAEKPIAAGHFIKLEGGEQGYVTKVGWRSTHLRMLGDTVVVVPNVKLAGNVITNFSLPKEELAVSVEAGVSYQSDLAQVERVTLEVAREVIAEMDGAIRTFEARMRYHTFGESSINFTVLLGATDFASGLAVKHEFVKRLHARYRRESISMPFPTRTIDVAGDTLAKLGGIFERRENRV